MGMVDSEPLEKIQMARGNDRMEICSDRLVGNSCHFGRHDVFTRPAGSFEIHSRIGRALASRHGRIHNIVLRTTHRCDLPKKAGRKVHNPFMEHRRTRNDSGAGLDGLARRQ